MYFDRWLVRRPSNFLVKDTRLHPLVGSVLNSPKTCNSHPFGLALLGFVMVISTSASGFSLQPGRDGCCSACVPRKLRVRVETGTLLNKLFIVVVLVLFVTGASVEVLPAQSDELVIGLIVCFNSLLLFDPFHA